MGADFHPLGKIEAVGGEPVHARIEVQFAATGLPGEGYEPLEHPPAVAPGTDFFDGDEVVHVANRTPGERLKAAQPGHDQDPTFKFQIRQVIALPCLAFHLREKFSFAQMGP